MTGKAEDKTQDESKTQAGGNTANALLGLLTLHPMSGYDMRAMTERTIGHFWRESYGQIYPTLRRLEKQGLVAKKTRQGEGRPAKNVFRVTAAGLRQLKEWLELAPTAEVPRNELLLKLFFGHHAPKGANRRHLEQMREAHLGALRHYEAMAEQLRREEEDDPQLPYWLMTLSFGRHHSRAFVAWAEETLAELERIERGGGKSKGKSRKGKSGKR